MGGEETTGTQVRSPPLDMRRASPGVAVGTLVRRGGKGGRNYNIRPRGVGDKGKRRRGGRGGRAGEIHVGAGDGVDIDGLLGQYHSGGGNLAGGSSNPKREKGIPRNRSRGGGVEGGGGDTQSLLHHLHHLPRLPPWVPGKTRYRELNPLGKTASVGFGHEGSGPPCDIPETAQGIQ